MNPFTAGLVPHSARIRSVANKDTAVQRNPLAGILVTVNASHSCSDLRLQIFSTAGRSVIVTWSSLPLGERKRLKRTQQPVLEYGFQFAHHRLDCSRRGQPQIELLLRPAVKGANPCLQRNFG